MPFSCLDTGAASCCKPVTSFKCQIPQCMLKVCISTYKQSSVIWLYLQSAHHEEVYSLTEPWAPNVYKKNAIYFCDNSNKVNNILF